MSGKDMMQPTNGQALPAQTIEQMGRVLMQVEQLMQGMASALAATNQRMEQLEKQMKLLTPITSAQEKAIGERIKLRAEELCHQYRLKEKCIAQIANAIRKDIKLTGGVRAIRDLPRVEYAVYIERVDLWDDYAVMKAIKRKNADA